MCEASGRFPHGVGAPLTGPFDPVRGAPSLFASKGTREGRAAPLTGPPHGEGGATLTGRGAQPSRVPSTSRRSSRTAPLLFRRRGGRPRRSASSRRDLRASLPVRGARPPPLAGRVPSTSVPHGYLRQASLTGTREGRCIALKQPPRRGKAPPKGEGSDLLNKY